MSPSTPLKEIQKWLQAHPGVFQLRQDGEELRLQELYSKKERSLKPGELQKVEKHQNRLKSNEEYLILLLESGAQLILAPQGFAFPPNFTNSGEIPLPSQVYCLQDFHQLFGQLEEAQQDPERKQEALELILVIIAILDGARAVGLTMEEEERQVEQVLIALESES